MDTRAKEIVAQGDRLFSKRLSLLSLWQEIAQQFYVERAHFTVSHSLGEEFADHLMSGYPLMTRRDLGNALSSMLRPNAKDWFSVRTGRPEKEDNQARRWLEWASQVQKRAMYDRKARFARATKEGDHDFVAFGQCVISTEINRRQSSLLYRCWHLRDVAWSEDETGEVSHVQRKWKPTLRELVRIFPGKCHENVMAGVERDPEREIECRHVIMPSEDYRGERKIRQPYVSLYVDCENGHVLEETGCWTQHYTIPRWQTVSGSQYAYSPATVVALPDARLLQAITLTLLEAGEKAVDPPLIAVQEALRSDVALYAGGITMLDAEYDERLGEALRPLTRDLRGIPLGEAMQRAAESQIREAFFLNKLSLPPFTGTPTATQVNQMVTEYIRNAMPLFEPIETEYSASLCEQTFELLRRENAFGSPDDLPDSLSGADIQFKFESPLHEAVERQKGQRALEAKQMLALFADTDPSAAAMIDARVALRESLEGMGVPAGWMRSDEAIEEIEAEQQQAAMAQQAIALASQAGDAAEKIGKGGAALGNATGGAVDLKALING
jgi:hypothetical protein